MTLTKKHWIIIGVVASLIAIYFLFIKKRKYTESSFDAALPLLGENSYQGSDIDDGVIESGYGHQLKKQIKQSTESEPLKRNYYALRNRFRRKTKLNTF